MPGLNPRRTYAAWTGAIAAAGLEGRYRQMEVGGWSAVTALIGRTSTASALNRSWDHIDTGIDKGWLAEDLKGSGGCCGADCSSTVAAAVAFVGRTLATTWWCCHLWCQRSCWGGRLPVSGSADCGSVLPRQGPWLCSVIST